METDEVLALLRRVGEECVDPRFGTLGSGDVDRKQLRAPVTAADREAEQRLTEELTRAHPGAVVVGEEAVAADPRLVARAERAEHAFVVDPVDGTRQFVKGSPDHAMMLAELRGGEVVRSWIWQPQHRRSYVAERGAGAWCGQRRLRGPEPERLAGLSRLRRLRAVRFTGTCCGVDYPRLAEGEADVAVFWSPRLWDHAPGSLLLLEAGGVVAGLRGGYEVHDRRPRLLVAAGDRAAYEAVRWRTV